MRGLVLMVVMTGCAQPMLHPNGNGNGDGNGSDAGVGGVGTPASGDLGGADLAPGGTIGTTKDGGALASGDMATIPSACNGWFPCDSFWYQDVSALPAAAGSSTITGAIGGWEKSDNNFVIDFSIVYMHADASTPLHTFTLDPGYDPDNDHDPVPVPAGGALEGETGYTCTNGGDCHLIVVDDATHKLFELWSVTSATGTFAATQETVWDLTKHYGPDGRGLGCTSADAAGLAILPGLIGVREVVVDKKINHALRFTLPNKYIRSGFVTPATHLTSAATSTAGPPYGARLRLKPTFDETTIASAGGKVVIRALKQYGMILADGSNYDTLIAEADTLESKADPTLSWQGVLGDSALSTLKASDFEVVQLGTVQTISDCTRAP